MQLGFVSAILPDQSLAEVLATAAEIGYDCVELMCWPPGQADRRYAGVTHVDVDQFDESRAAEALGVADKSGVSISALGYYPNPLDPDPEVARTAVEHIRKVISACPMLGVGTMNTFAGRDPTRSIDDNWPRFLDTWRPLVAFAEELDVRIGIENCPMLFTADEWPGGKNLAISPAIWRRMFDEIPSAHFGLNYDPSHLAWQQMDWIAPLHEFADRLVHVHAKDVRIERRRHWVRFAAVLREVGYDGPVCVEVEDRDFEESLEKRREALEWSHALLRKCEIE